MSDVASEDLSAALAWHGEGFVRVVGELPPDAPVPTCPGWDVGGLAWHLAGVWARSTNVLRQGNGREEDFRGYEMRARPGPDVLPGWCGEVLLGLVMALREADPSAPTWNWTGRQLDASWWRRRLTHETAMHHVDAALVRGEDVEVAHCLAADGVDEFFASYVPRSDGGPLAGEVDVLADDVRGAAWRARLVDGRLDVARLRDVEEHREREPAAVVRGPAEQLLRWVWRRPATVEVAGDGHVAAQLQAWCFPE